MLPSRWSHSCYLHRIAEVQTTCVRAISFPATEPQGPDGWTVVRSTGRARFVRGVREGPPGPLRRVDSVVSSRPGPTYSIVFDGGRVMMKGPGAPGKQGRETPNL